MNTKIEEICKIAYSFKDTVYFTYNITQELIKKGFQGCYVECGVAGGAQIAAMKQAMQDLNVSHTIYGFDSFEGIPLAGPRDLEQPGIGRIEHDTSLSERDRLVSSGITVHSRECVEENFHRLGLPINNIFLIKGWFQDTLPVFKNPIGDISLLRLDGDLYESTICCLENLYENIVNGGVIIVDDYQLQGARDAIHEFFERKGVNPVLHEIEGSGGVKYFYKQEQ